MKTLNQKSELYFRADGSGFVIRSDNFFEFDARWGKLILRLKDNSELMHVFNDSVPLEIRSKFDEVGLFVQSTRVDYKSDSSKRLLLNDNKNTAFFGNVDGLHIEEVLKRIQENQLLEPKLVVWSYKNFIFLGLFDLKGSTACPRCVLQRFAANMQFPEVNKMPIYLTLSLMKLKYVNTRIYSQVEYSSISSLMDKIIETNDTRSIWIYDVDKNQVEKASVVPMPMCDFCRNV